MKGIIWDGSHFATKGTSLSKGWSMFSVGGLVAFTSHRYCSPDGRNSSDGCDLMSSTYLLQEEITLESFNHTVSNQYGSGDFDTQKVVDLRDKFRHEHYGSRIGTKYFLCGIVGDENPRLGTGEHARIEEVRNHPGKFLHVYPIGSRAWNLTEKASSFEEAVNLILDFSKSEQSEMEHLEKVATEKRTTLGVSFTEEGIRLAILRAKKTYGADTFYGETRKEGKISQMEVLLKNVVALNKGEAVVFEHTSAYYSKPDTSIVASDDRLGAPSLDIDRGSNIVVYKIAKKVLLHDGRIYCGSFKDSTVVDVFQNADGTFNYNKNLYTSWCNSQSWNESVRDYTFKRFEIRTGEEGEMVSYNQELARRAEARKEKFEKLSGLVKAKYGEEIFKKILANRKGQVLAIFEWLQELDVPAKDVVFLLNAKVAFSKQLLQLMLDRPDQKMVRRVIPKAYAWAYLVNAGLEKNCEAHFDEALAVLKVYANLELPETVEVKTSFGFTLGDFAGEKFNQLRKQLGE